MKCNNFWMCSAAFAMQNQNVQYTLYIAAQWNINCYCKLNAVERKKMHVELNFTHFLLKKCDWKKSLVVFPFIIFYWGVQSPPSQNKFEREKIIEWWKMFTWMEWSKQFINRLKPFNFSWITKRVGISCVIQQNPFGIGSNEQSQSFVWFFAPLLCVDGKKSNMNI